MVSLIGEIGPDPVSQFLTSLARVIPGDITPSSHLKPSDIIERIKEAQAQVLPLRDQEVVMVIGKKGAGKSTFINYMADRPQKKVLHRGKFIIETIDPLTPVGHSKSACTTFPRVYTFGTPPINFCDCPGFDDNRGLDTEIANAASLLQMAKTSKKIKCLVLCVEYNRCEKGTVMRNNIHTAIDFLGNAALINSVFLLLTKASIDKEIALENVVAGLVVEAQETQQLSKSPSMHAFEHIVRLGNVGFYYPNGERAGETFVYDREMIRKKIASFQGIENPKNSFNIPLSPEAFKQIGRCIDTAEDDILEHIRQRDLNAYKFAEILMSIGDLLGLLGAKSEIMTNYNKFIKVLSVTIANLAYKNDSLDYLKNLLSVLPPESDIYQDVKASLDALENRLKQEKFIADQQKQIDKEKAENEEGFKNLKISRAQFEKKQKELKEQENINKEEARKIQEAKKNAEKELEKSNEFWKKTGKAVNIVTYLLIEFLKGMAAGVGGGSIGPYRLSAGNPHIFKPGNFPISFRARL